MAPLVSVYRGGRLTQLQGISYGGLTVVIAPPRLAGPFLRVATVDEEWFSRVTDPDAIVSSLRSSKAADLFTFWQLLPETEPLFRYPMEPVAISALPLTSFDGWLDHQIRKEVRKNIRKAARRGVEIRAADFDDAFVNGLTAIFNESPVRQGRPFWHYGKSTEEVRREMGQTLERSHFLGAYLDGVLVGFYKLMMTESSAQPVMSMSMLKHRDKYVDTALISEAVKFCCDRGLSYMTYGEWRRDSHRAFLESHGFTKVLVPRYHVPLTRRGAVALRLGAHKSFKEMLPKPVLERLLAARERWYARRFPQPAAAADSGAAAAV